MTKGVWVSIMSVTMIHRQRERGSSRKSLEVKLVGNFEMRSLDKVYALDKRKACAILAYLLLNGQTRETRGRLSALLWSDKDEERARASLRQSIRDLKDIESAAGVEFLLVDKLSVGIDHTIIDTDVSAVRHALAERDFAAADTILSEGEISLCTGLQDCDPVFDNWIRTTSSKLVGQSDPTTIEITERGEPYLCRTQGHRQLHPATRSVPRGGGTRDASCPVSGGWLRAGPRLL